MKAPSFPKPALGDVTINGHVISKGSVIQEFGTLVVDGGGYDVSTLSLYNNDQLWTPIATYDNKIEFSLLSNGRFTLRSSSRKVIFEFSNDNAQDFSILSINYPDSSSEGLSKPGSVISSYTYAQFVTLMRGGFIIFVKSTGTPITSLTPTISQGARVSYKSYEDLGETWLRITIYGDDYPNNTPCEVKLGNVLVFYIERFNDL